MRPTTSWWWNPGSFTTTSPSTSQASAGQSPARNSSTLTRWWGVVVIEAVTSQRIAKGCDIHSRTTPRRPTTSGPADGWPRGGTVGLRTARTLMIGLVAAACLVPLATAPPATATAAAAPDADVSVGYQVNALHDGNLDSGVEI